MKDFQMFEDENLEYRPPIVVETKADYYKWYEG